MLIRSIKGSLAEICKEEKPTIEIFPDLLTLVEFGKEGDITVVIRSGGKITASCTVQIDYMHQEQTNLLVYVS